MDSYKIAKYNTKIIDLAFSKPFPINKDKYPFQITVYEY